MCGIAGVFRYRGNQPLDISVGMRMTESLVHRGPDGGGLLVTDDLLLGHRRLSVIDPSEDGAQPMSSRDEQVWISYNGEVYNFRELRKELEAIGHTFVSKTDTEVILQGYLRWGIDVVERIQGMFAFAIWDRRSRTVHLVRDGMGIKPLFYRHDGERLWFGSEAKSICQSLTTKPCINQEAINSFLTFGYVPLHQTGFQGIDQLPPGHRLTIDESGPTLTKWFSLPYPKRKPTESLAEASTRLSDALKRSVRRQMVSDVPLGALLSGGLDSSAIVSCMTSESANENRVQTFTVAMSERSFDESPYAAQAAKVFGTKHHQRTAGAKIAELLPPMIAHCEEPLADNSSLAFYSLCEFTRQHVTVALSGDGADELMGGYSTYRASQLAGYYRRLPSWIRDGLIGPAVERFPAGTTKYNPVMLAQRFLRGADETAPRDHARWRQMLPDAIAQRILSEPMRRLNRAHDPIADYVGTLDDAPDELNDFERNLHMDLRFHLPADILTKADRMSMAHSLEIRVPILDEEVVSTCLSMASIHKRVGKRGKLALKEVLRPQLPKALLNRKKAGFVLPIEHWVKNEWRGLLREKLDARFCEGSGLFDAAAMRTLVEANDFRGYDAYALFTLLTLAMWWEVWIEQSQPTATRTTQAVPLKVIYLSDGETPS